MSEKERVYLDCPDCGNQWRKPLYRGQVHGRACTNHRHNGRCRRFVIAVDPTGEDHWFEPVEANETYEDVADAILPRHRERNEKAMFLRLAMERAG